MSESVAEMDESPEGCVYSLGPYYVPFLGILPVFVAQGPALYDSYLAN